MSIRLTCSICKKPDSRMAIIFDDPSEIDGWLPYTCCNCLEKGYNAKEELKAKKKVQNFEDSDLFKEMKENEEKEKLGLIRCPLCDRFSPMNDVRKKGGSFVERLCDKCKPRRPQNNENTVEVKAEKNDIISNMFRKIKYLLSQIF